MAALSALYKIVRFHRIEPARQRLLEGLTLQLRRATTSMQGSKRKPAAVRVLRSISETETDAMPGTEMDASPAIEGDPFDSSSGRRPPASPTSPSALDRTPPPRNSPMAAFEGPRARDSGAQSCDSRHLSVVDASLADTLGALSVVNQSVYGADEMVHVALVGSLQQLVYCLASPDASVVILALRVLEGFADADEQVHLSVLREGAITATEALLSPGEPDAAGQADQATPEITQAGVAASERLLLNLSDDRREGLFRQLLDLWTSRCHERSLYHVSRCVHELATRSTVEWDYVRASLGSVLVMLREGGPWGVKAALHMLHCLCSLDTSAKHKAVSLGCCVRLSAMIADPQADDETRRLCAAGLAALACGRAGAETAAEHASVLVGILRTAKPGSPLQRAVVNALGNMVSEMKEGLYSDALGKAGAGTRSGRQAPQ